MKKNSAARQMSAKEKEEMYFIKSTEFENTYIHIIPTRTFFSLEKNGCYVFRSGIINACMWSKSGAEIFIKSCGIKAVPEPFNAAKQATNN